jgi:xylulokinase
MKYSFDAPYLLGIDIGTTGCKCVIFDIEGHVICGAYKEYPTLYPNPMWAEQNANHWWYALLSNLKKLDKLAPLSKVIGVGISGQMEGVVPVDRNGNPLRNCIIWSDQRGLSYCNRIKERIDERVIYNITGCRIDPMHTALKILWLKEHEQQLFSNTHKFLSAKDFIKYKLTDTFTTDPSTASSTLMFDIKKISWSDHLLELMDIPVNKLPELHPSNHIIGEITYKASKKTGLKRGTPVICGGGDTSCSMLSTGAVSEKDATAYIGTSASLYVNVANPTFDTKMRMICRYHVIPRTWMLGGGMSTAGDCLRWYINQFGHAEVRISKKLKVSPYKIIEKEVKKVRPGAEGLLFLPHLMGERNPVYNLNARGVIFGLTISHERMHLLRAIMEGVAFQLRYILETIQDMGFKIEKLYATGGGAKSRVWRRIIANVLNKSLFLSASEASECLGVAILTGFGVGVYKDLSEAAKQMTSTIKEQKPEKKYSDKYDTLYKKYKQLEEIFSRTLNLRNNINVSSPHYKLARHHIAPISYDNLSALTDRSLHVTKSL